MKPGIYADIPNEDYHHGPGTSNSDLKLVRQGSPLHLFMRKRAANDNAPKVSTPAQMIGTACHALLLEPDVFTRDYCLALRPSDVPGVIESRDQLVALCEQINGEREQALAGLVSSTDELKSMIATANASRMPKLATGGSKADLIARVISAGIIEECSAATLAKATLSELKFMLDEANEKRPGLLSTSGSEADLIATLRGAGVSFMTRKEAMAKWQAERGTPMLLDTKGSMQDMAASLRADGQPVTLWAEVKAEWLINNSHRLVLEQEQFDQLRNMQAAVMAHPVARRLMSRPGKAEQSVYWIDPVTGILCRCRPDWWTDDDLIVDVKTCDDASPEGFRHSIEKWGYEVQDAFYTDGTTAVGRKPRAFLFLAIQKDACVIDGQSFGVAVYQMDDASRELGRAKYRNDLATVAECERTGVWPNYGDTVLPIVLSDWQFKKNSHLLDQQAAG